MLPELGSQRMLGLSGALLALKEIFLLVLGSLFLFLCPRCLAGHWLGQRGASVEEEQDHGCELRELFLQNLSAWGS